MAAHVTGTSPSLKNLGQWGMSPAADQGPGQMLIWPEDFCATWSAGLSGGQGRRPRLRASSRLTRRAHPGRLRRCSAPGGRPCGWRYRRRRRRRHGRARLGVCARDRRLHGRHDRPAARHRLPDRVRSLTSSCPAVVPIATMPTLAAMRALGRSPPVTSPDEAAEAAAAVAGHRVARLPDGRGGGRDIARRSHPR